MDDGIPDPDLDPSNRIPGVCHHVVAECVDWEMVVEVGVVVNHGKANNDQHGDTSPAQEATSPVAGSPDVVDGDQRLRFPFLGKTSVVDDGGLDCGRRVRHRYQPNVPCTFYLLRLCTSARYMCPRSRRGSSSVPFSGPRFHRLAAEVTMTASARDLPLDSLDHGLWVVRSPLSEVGHMSPIHPCLRCSLRRPAETQSRARILPCWGKPVV